LYPSLFSLPFFPSTFITHPIYFVYSHNIQNPLSEPRAEIVIQRVDAVKECMLKRWLQVLMEVKEKEKKMYEEATKIELADT
jgi:hypothetical protein